VNVIAECRDALDALDYQQVDRTVKHLRSAGRVFCYGNGGGYAHAMHFASDLRKIAKKQSFSFDNVAEMTARINDDGWSFSWDAWRQSFGTVINDTTFLFSVGGALDGVSRNLQPAPAWGIVGANGGGLERIVIPSTSTPVVEGCQSVIAHHIVEQLCG
jgi:D-sedoheptulose 7-phosphate isomerase